MKKTPFSLIVILLLILIVPSVSAEWWDNDWDKRTEIVLTETSGTTLNNFSILLTIPFDSDMNTDFSDIRFVDSTHTTELNYWIESKTDGVETKVWILIPTLPTSSNTSIFFYYDNPIATSNSNFNTAFIYADDFETNTLSNYNIVGNICTNSAINNGRLIVDILGSQAGPCTITPKPQFQLLSDNYIVEAIMTVNNNCAHSGVLGHLPTIDYFQGGHAAWFHPGIDTLGNLVNIFGVHQYLAPAVNNGIYLNEINPLLFKDTFYEIDFILSGSQKKAILDNNLEVNINNSSFQSGLYGVAGLYEGCNVPTQTKIEWFRVRPFSSQDPTFNVGNEEERAEDSDDDGVPDDEDLCPNSRLNEPVDDNGCDIFQFCSHSGFSCGNSCLTADWRNNEPNSQFPNDCTVIIPLRNGQEQQPICVPTVFDGECAG